MYELLHRFGFSPFLICTSKATSLPRRWHRWRNWAAICIILRFRFGLFFVYLQCCKFAALYQFGMDFPMFFFFFPQTACSICSALIVFYGNCSLAVGILLNLAKRSESWFIRWQLSRGSCTSPTAHPQPRSSLFFQMVPSWMATANHLPSSKAILYIRSSLSNYLHALCHYPLITPLLFLGAHCLPVLSSYSYIHFTSSGHVQTISALPLRLYLPGI